MGHFMDIEFEAKLNEFGTKAISMLYAAEAWDEVHKTFWEHSYLFADLARHDPVIPFSGQFKENKHSFDEAAGVWQVRVGFKWKWPVDAAIQELLPHIIKEPVVLHVSHDLWDKPHIRTVSPK